MMERGREGRSWEQKKTEKRKERIKEGEERKGSYYKRSDRWL